MKTTAYSSWTEAGISSSGDLRRAEDKVGRYQRALVYEYSLQFSLLTTGHDYSRLAGS